MCPFQLGHGCFMASCLLSATPPAVRSTHVLHQAQSWDEASLPVCIGVSWWVMVNLWMRDLPFRRRDPVKSFKVKPVWCKYEDLEFGTDVPTSCPIYQFGPSWDDKHTSIHSFAESGFSGHSALLYHGGTGAGRCWWANEPGKIGNSKRSHWERE